MECQQVAKTESGDPCLIELVKLTGQFTNRLQPRERRHTGKGAVKSPRLHRADWSGVVLRAEKGEAAGVPRLVGQEHQRCRSATLTGPPRSPERPLVGDWGVRYLDPG